MVQIIKETHDIAILGKQTGINNPCDRVFFYELSGSSPTMWELATTDKASSVMKPKHVILYQP